MFKIHLLLTIFHICFFILPSNLAPTIFAPFQTVPSSLAPVKFASVKSPFKRIAPVKFTFPKYAFSKFPTLAFPLKSLSPSTNSYISIQFVLSIHSYNLSPDTLFCSIQTSHLHSASLSVN